MKQSELTLLYSYIYNNRLMLKNEVRTMQANLRYRDIDVIDCIELALAVERYNTFKETTNQIKLLLKMEDIKKTSRKSIFKTLTDMV